MATTDAEGKYSYAVGPGNYTICQNEALPEQKIESNR